MVATNEIEEKIVKLFDSPSARATEIISIYNLVYTLCLSGQNASADQDKLYHFGCQQITTIVQRIVRLACLEEEEQSSLQNLQHEWAQFTSINSSDKNPILIFAMCLPRSQFSSEVQ
jgi:hypothetical protein